MFVIAAIRSRRSIGKYGLTPAVHLSAASRRICTDRVDTRPKGDIDNSTEIRLDSSHSPHCRNANCRAGHELDFANGQYFIVPQHLGASLRTSWIKSFWAFRRLCSSKAIRSNADLFGHSALRIGLPSVTFGSVSTGRQTIEWLPST